MIIKSISTYVQDVLWAKVRIINFLLLPFSIIYFLISKLKYNLLQTPKKITATVICVGNATVGGSGKTPSVCAIAKALYMSGKKVAIISKGYKGNLARNSICIKIDNKKHNYLEVGDEALLLSSIAPTYISKSRLLAANTAIKDGAEIIILDDGLQDNSIYKDYTILAINKLNFLNKFLIPAGPFRERLKDAYRKCDFIIHPHYLNQKDLNKLFNPDKLKVNYKETIINKHKLEGKNFILLTGIANPKRVVKSLLSLNINILQHYAFPDHHQFTNNELEIIHKEATIKNCNILTTNKDYVRIPKPFKKNMSFIEYELQFSEKNLSTLFDILDIKKNNFKQ